MEAINIEEIMQEIRAEIKEKGYKESDLSFSDVPLSNLSEASGGSYDQQVLMNVLYEANSRVNVDYYQPVGGGIKGFIKKIIRKIMSPIAAPIVGEQNGFNAATVQTLNQMNQYILQLEKRIITLEKQLEEK